MILYEDQTYKGGFGMIWIDLVELLYHPCMNLLGGRFQGHHGTMCSDIYTLVMTNITTEHGPLIVDLPIRDGDFPSQTVSLPEGISPLFFVALGDWVIIISTDYPDPKCQFFERPSDN